MDFRLTAEQELLRRSVREFAETEIRPHVREWDQAQQFPAESDPAARRARTDGHPVSGGVRRRRHVGDRLLHLHRGAGARRSRPSRCRWPPTTGSAPRTSRCSGTEQQKQQYLVPLARGEKIGAWGLTESTSGSDAAAMRTTAARSDGGWVLNGSKTFTTHGRVGDVLVVMAVTAPRAARSKGISAFIVEKGTPGFSPGKKEDKLGMRASDTSEVLFENCRVPADQLLGKEGHGFVDTMQVLDAGRIGIAALAVGLAQGAYEAALHYARERKAFGKTIGSFQAIQWKLADNATRIEAARLLTYRAAYLKDRAERTTLESAMAKLYASEIAVKAADDCVQILGGYGFVKDYPAEKYFRDVKLTTIGEGTSEIQRLVIARQLLAR